MSQRGVPPNCPYGIKQDITYYKFISITKDESGQEYALYELITEHVLWVPYLLRPSTLPTHTEDPLDLSLGNDDTPLEKRI